MSLLNIPNVNFSPLKTENHLRLLEAAHQLQMNGEIPVYIVEARKRMQALNPDKPTPDLTTVESLARDLHTSGYVTFVAGNTLETALRRFRIATDSGSVTPTEKGVALISDIINHYEVDMGEYQNMIHPEHGKTR